jgi:hypothetical protein
MNYTDIFRIMKETGLEQDPAFTRVNFLIQPIPMMDGCPLGLYVPERKDIILPPEFIPAAAYHEIGHAYGDYHDHNISEQYAEAFRKKYMGNNAAVYVGSNFPRLKKMGRIFQEGEKGRVDIAVRRMPTAAELADMRATFSGVNEPSPKVWASYDGMPVLHIAFTKGADWFVIIAGALMGIVVAAVGALAYAIYKVANDMPWVVPLTIAGAGAGLLLWAAYRSWKRGTLPARR